MGQSRFDNIGKQGKGNCYTFYMSTHEDSGEARRNATLLFLVRREEGKITNLCLAMKKRGFGVDRWNGVGGKVGEDETIEGATIRETEEEIGVTPRNLKKVAHLQFTFLHNPAFDQNVHVFITEEWEGEPTESEEMRPEWVPVDNVPYDSMWPDDIFWLPEVLNGNNVEASFTFGPGDTIEDKEVNIVDLVP